MHTCEQSHLVEQYYGTKNQVILGLFKAVARKLPLHTTTATGVGTSRAEAKETGI